jgi:hypothetical protein
VATDARAKPRRGDKQTDRYGTVWIVTHVHSESGGYQVSRVRAGSLAHAAMVAEDRRLSEQRARGA